MPTEREMTLEEWCAELSSIHLVNKELRELKAERDRYKELADYAGVEHEETPYGPGIRHTKGGNLWHYDHHVQDIEAERDRYRAALERIDRLMPANGREATAIRIAREALAGDEHEVE